MSGVALDPEIRKAWETDRKMRASGLADELAAERESGERAGAFWSEGGPQMHSRAMIDLSVGGRRIAMDLLLPSAEPSLPVVLFMHGGGWRSGSPRSSDGIMRSIAAQSGCAVAGLRYSLSPEIRYPGALDEVVAAVAWLQKNGAAHGLDPAQVALSGVSAGANLAVCAALRLRDEARAPASALALFVGCYGQGEMTESRRLFDSAGTGPTASRMITILDGYCPQWRTLPEPYVVPLLAKSFAGLPPAFICAAGCDPLRDESHALAKRMQADGVKVMLHEAPGATHGFTKYERMAAVARNAIAASAAFLANRLRLAQAPRAARA
jgi:acetyl esterase